MIDSGMLKLQGNQGFRRAVWLVLDVLPVILSVGLAIFGCIAVLLLLAGQLKSEYVFPLGGILATLGMLYVIRLKHREQARELGNEDKIALIVVLAFVTIWALFNIGFSSQHVFVNRDPGVYTVTAKFIKDNQSLEIPAYTNLQVVPGIQSGSLGFGNSVGSPDDLYTQGAHLLPALLGLGARVFGENAIFNVNVIFGAFALLAVFGVARIYMKPRWALASVATMGFLLPMIYFSRDTYTEPLTLLFTFGGIALVHMALHYKKMGLWFIAGIVLGAGTLTRIDSLLTIAAVVLFGVLYLAGVQASMRKKEVLSVGMLFIGMTITASTGLVDVQQLSSGYYLFQKHNMDLELYLIGAILLFGIFAIIVSWRTRAWKWIDEKTKAWRGVAGAGVVVGIFVILASRPLWVSDLKDSAENTVSWLAVYAGPLILMFGVLGLSILTFKILKSRANLILYGPLLLIVLSTSFVYLVVPNISPDQIWASRRMLPVIYPGLIIAAWYMLSILWDSKRILPRIAVWKRRTIFGIVIGLTILSPLIMSSRFLTLTSYGDAITFNKVCRAIPSSSAVLWVGLIGQYTTVSARAFCGVQSIGFNTTPFEVNQPRLTRDDLSRLAAAAAKEGRQVYVGIYGSEASAMLPVGSIPSFVTESATTNVEFVANRPPVRSTTELEDILIGSVTPDGQIINLGNTSK